MLLLIALSCASIDAKREQQFSVEKNTVAVRISAGESVVAARRSVVSAAVSAAGGGGGAARSSTESERQNRGLVKTVRDPSVEQALTGAGIIRSFWRRLSSSRRPSRKADLARFEATSDDVVLRLSPSKPGWAVHLVELEDDDETLIVRRNSLLATTSTLTDAGSDGVGCTGTGFVALQAPGQIRSDRLEEKKRVDVQAAHIVAWIPISSRRHQPLLNYAGIRWLSFDSKSIDTVFSASCVDEPTVVVLQRQRDASPLRPDSSGMARLANRMLKRTIVPLAFALVAFFALALAHAGFRLADTPKSASQLAATLVHTIQVLSRAARAAKAEMF